MRPSIMRLVRPRRPGILGNEVNLLPPLSLYRRVLRAHRRLPFEHRLLGDDYVKNEFRLHKDVENPLYIVGFLTSWQQYAEQIEGDRWKDAKIDAQKLEKMSDEQIIQFYELMQSAQGRTSEYSHHFYDDLKAKKGGN
ncbi:succinate dehydrogenase [Dipodascopsis uninucleata]